jgi:hypothetical protein
MVLPLLESLMHGGSLPMHYLVFVAILWVHPVGIFFGNLFRSFPVGLWNMVS